MKHNYTLAKERELKLVECLNNNLDDTKFNQIANYINNELGYNFDSFPTQEVFKLNRVIFWVMLVMKLSLLK